MKKFDVVITGAGPGGYVAGIRARQLGMSVALVEKDSPGGVCLNWGCIPSKSLIHQAEQFSHLDTIQKWGVKIDRSGFDYAKVQAESRKAADVLSKGVQGLIKKNKIEYFSAEARFENAQTIVLSNGEKIQGSHVIIATGSRPREIPGFEFDEKQVLSSTGMLSLTELPQKMIILGGGAIGIEFAFVCNAFGVDVTIVEMMEEILPLEDREHAHMLRKILEARGITILTGTQAGKLKKEKSGLSLEIKKDGKSKTIRTEKLLVAVGRAPNTDLGLEKAGVTMDRGYIVTGDYGQTSVPSVYAIGDVTMSPQLAHVASKEGEIAVEHMAGHKPEPQVSLVPSAVYCEPQVASFGPTEEQLTADKKPYKKMVFPYRGAGKSVAIAATEGSVKLLCDEHTHEILACHIIGRDATELIHEVLLAKSSELLPEDMATLIHAHPTLSEALMEAARGIEGWAIHR